MISWLVKSISGAILFFGVLLGFVSPDLVQEEIATTTISVPADEEIIIEPILKEKDDNSQTHVEVFPDKDQQIQALKNRLRDADLGGVVRSKTTRSCDEELDNIDLINNREKQVAVRGSVIFTFELADDSYDYDAIEIYATDSDDVKAGHMSYPGYEGKNISYSLSSAWDVRRYGDQNVLILSEYIDGYIRVRNIGSEAHMFSFYISDSGSNCDITNKIWLGMSTSSTLVIPISKEGDLGPMEWDFESDGVVDMYESLVFELSEEQIRLTNEIDALIHPNEIRSTCKYLNEWTLPQENQELFRGAIITKKWCAEKNW